MEPRRAGLEILDESECLALLASGSLGRVGVTIGALPAILPVNYTMSGSDIVFRTAPGTKLSAALRNTVVAFEVDYADWDRREGWSVLAIGEAEVVEPDQVEADVQPFLPGLQYLVRIRPEMLSGRRIAHTDA